MDNKKVMVLGMGRTGKAVCAFLDREGATAEPFDDAIPIANLSDLICKNYDYAVVSPGVPLTHPAVVTLKTNGVPVLSELDLAYINCPSKLVFAISGTNGKTTACTVLHTLLSSVGRSHLVGNVGVPWIGEVKKIAKKDFVVAEVSSFQLEQNRVFKPYAAALTNVGEDHLDRHFTRERYQRLKLSLLEKAAIKVVNRDDPVQRGIAGAVEYSTLDPAAEYYLCRQNLYCHGKKYKIPYPSRGAAYDADFLCAFAVAASVCGVRRRFLTLYDKVKVPPYRCAYVGKLCGADVYNDSKGTNVDATIFAASRFSKSVALILGGSDKGEDYSRLFAALKGNVLRIYLSGANAKEMYLAAGDKTRAKCRLMPDLDSCVKDFTQQPTDVLLFSPASASFDRYENYEERGKCFDEIVAKYATPSSRV